MPKKPAQPPELIKEIRENYDYAKEFWDPLHKEGNQDARYIAADPWDPKDINARETAEQKRPHLVFDEGSQYINMFIGQAMQQQRAVKVEPIDQRADGKTAEVMQGRIQHIDYTSRGQTHCLKALRDCAIRSYGWISLRKRYSSEKGREQEPCFNPVPNPDSRLMDPDAKEPDGSDAEFVFVRDTVKKKTIRKKWKWARELGQQNQMTVVLVEYWRREKKVVDQNLWLEDSRSPQGVEILKSALPQGSTVGEDSVTMGSGETAYTVKILDSRDIEEIEITKYVCQLTDDPPAPKENADDAAVDSVEILEVEEWDSKYIPEVPVLGPREYVNDGGTVKVVQLSMLRRARDPMGLLNLTRSNEAETVAMTPKTRFLGYEGQFENHEDEFANIGTSPLGYLQVRPIVDPTTNEVLPLPTQLRWEPPIQALELLASSCENAIRSAVGQLASPELDKTKSGVALQKIREGGESAVYYITESYTRSLEQVGRVEGDLIERTHDTKRDIPIRKPDGKQRIVTINAPYDDENKQRQHYPIAVGAFNYTITTGPSYQSQFEQSSDFVDKLIQSVPQLLVDGAGQTTFGDLFVQLKNLGPIGDQITDRFRKMLRPNLQDAPVDIPPQVHAELQKGQQVINALTQRVNELQEIIKTKAVERESEDERNKRDNETKLAVAQINASVKENIAQLEAVMDSMAQRLNQQFEQMMANPPAAAPQLPGGSAATTPASPSAPGAAPIPPGVQAATGAPTHVFNPEDQQIQPAGAQ